MIIFLLVSILVGLIAVLALVIWHRLHLKAIAANLERAPAAAEETLKDVVRAENAATRLHVSQAVDGIRHDTDATKIRLTDYIDRENRDASEFRGQLTAIKQRVQSMILSIDTLAKHIVDSFKKDKPP